MAVPGGAAGKQPPQLPGAPAYHLRPRLSGLLLAEVDLAVLQRLFTGMLDDGVPEATTRRVYSTIRSALNAAAREQLVPGNPTQYLVVPAGRRPHAVVWTARRVKQWKRTGKRPAVAVWTPAQTRRFLADSQLFPRTTGLPAALPRHEVVA